MTEIPIHPHADTANELNAFRVKCLRVTIHAHDTDGAISPESLRWRDGQARQTEENILPPLRIFVRFFQGGLGGLMTVEFLKTPRTSS